MFLLLPIYTLFFLGAAQRYTPSWSFQLHLSLAMGLVLFWMMLGGSVLCQLQWLTPLCVVIWMTIGPTIACLYSRPSVTKDLVLSRENGVVLLLIPYLLMSYVPPWYRDSLTYHLTLPRLWSEQTTSAI